ncbi:hypothetical protein T08_1745 [Trichinella sp. T8]|nr:hypothetical protein T08_1745 [Trichinella sp. T8]
MSPSWSVILLVAIKEGAQICCRHMYHINTAITGTCIRQPFTILYRLKFICMLKARIVGNA